MQSLLEKAPKVVSADAQLLLMQHYHEEFGIARYDDMDMRPLTHVAMHPAEDPFDGSPRTALYKRFADLNMKDVWGLSIAEFLRLPKHECEELFEIAEVRRKRELKHMQEAADAAAAAAAANKQT